MEDLSFIYYIKGKEYNVFVKRGHQRNIYFRIKEDGFHVSAPYLARKSDIVKGLDKFAENLLTKFNKRNDNYSFEEDWVYIFGDKISLSSIGVSDEDDLDKFLKKLAKVEITSLVREEEQIMEINEPYKVSIRKTVAQLGSNSKKTHTLSFQQNLIHYSKDIIMSVVVHELAHDKVRNHQKEFYDIVYKYCPDYKIIQRKLKKGIRK